MCEGSMTLQKSISRKCRSHGVHWYSQILYYFSIMRFSEKSLHSAPLALVYHMTYFTNGSFWATGAILGDGHLKAESSCYQIQNVRHVALVASHQQRFKSAVWQVSLILLMKDFTFLEWEIEWGLWDKALITGRMCPHNHLLDIHTFTFRHLPPV